MFSSKWTKSTLKKSNELGPQYLRVLGFNEKGRELLKMIKKNSSIPIISTASLYKQVLEGVEKDITEEKRLWDVDSELYLWQFEKDLLASDIYTFLYPNKSTRTAGMDFEQPVRI